MAVVVAVLLAIGCGGSESDDVADGATADTGLPVIDGSMADTGLPVIDAPPGDAAQPDAPTPDAGPPVGVCGLCTDDPSCGAGARCHDSGGGAACLVTCDLASPVCPTSFVCQTVAGRAEPLCVPVAACCVDEDLDGYGVGDDCAGADCNDGDGGANPGAPEICNGADDDCDGVTPPTEADGDGDGYHVCDGDCDDGDLTAYPGALEECDGVDDDCDAVADNGDPGGGAVCATGLSGVCAAGTDHCVTGAVACVPDVAPGTVPETCNDLDDDCDGAVDQGNPGGGLSCMTGLLGLCASGVTSCQAGAGVVCVPSVTPGTLAEACNGLDDDCNGLSDDGIAQVGMPCLAGGFVGICQFGTYSCPAVAPFALTCDHPLPGTIAETCNSQDDDCNGTIDDPALLNGMPCSTAFPGVCMAGSTLCSGGAMNCIANVPPGSMTELCNALDDNCNGITDEMNPTPACTTQNPSATFVQTWGCTGGTCGIAACTSGHADIDTAPGNGCECATDAYQNMCSVAGTVSVPSSGTVNMVGKIESASGSDFLTFNFTVPAVGAAYHPKIELVDSAGGQYAMDVLADCANAAGCSTVGGVNNENGIQTNVWEANYNGYTAGAGCCSDDTPRVSSRIVRVYRKFGDSPTCSAYTITATNP